MDWNGADPIVELEGPFQEHRAVVVDDARDETEEDGSVCVHHGAAGGDGNQAPEHTVCDHERIHALLGTTADPGNQGGADSGKARRDQGVRRDDPDVARSFQRASTIEPEPSEEEDDRPEIGQRDIVGAHLDRLTLGGEPAAAGTDDHDRGQGDPRPHGMDHGRSGEVDESSRLEPALAFRMEEASQIQCPEMG